MVPKHREVRTGTEVKLSCEISDLDGAVHVQWLRGADVITTGGDFTDASGSQESGKQTATLRMKGSAVKEDTIFTCRVRSNQYDNSPSSDTKVNLEVYGE